MAVETPELQMPVFQPQQMAAPPQQPTQPSQTLPTSAGYVSKAAAGAYVANNLLQGWLRGREYAQQANISKAKQQLSGADYTYQTMAKNYNDLLRSGKAETDPSVQQAKDAASRAWQAKLNVMQQYATPEQQTGQKKTTGQRIKGGLSKTFGKGGLTPELIPQASLAVLRQSPPPGLGLTAEDKLTQQRVEQSQLETKEAGLRVENLQAQSDTRKEYTGLLKAGENITPTQKMQRDIDERILGLSTEEQQTARDVQRKILTGQMLTDGERQFAIGKKMIEGPQTAITEDGLKQYITRYDPNTGQVLSKTLIGKKFHESAAADAIAVLHAQQQGAFSMYKKAFPDKPDEEIWKLVSADFTKNPYLTSELLGDSPQQAAKDQFAVSNAIKSVMQEFGTGPEGQKGKAEFSNFVVPPKDNDQTGLYMFSGQVADPKSSGMLWWKKNLYAGDLSKEELVSKASAYRNRLAAQLQKQRRTPSDINRMLQPFDQEIQSLRGGGAQMATSPSGAQPYRITAGGQSVTRNLTSDQVEALQQGGASVEPMSMGAQP
jgi:hypothetical protein